MRHLILGGSPVSGTLSHLPTDDLSRLYHLAITDSPFVLSRSSLHLPPPVFVLGGGKGCFSFSWRGVLYIPHKAAAPLGLRREPGLTVTLTHMWTILG